MFNNFKITVMKKKNLLWSLLTTMMVGLLSVGFVSCGDDDDPDEVSVSMSSVNFGENGGSQSIQVTSNTKWTVSGSPAWLAVSPMQGTKNGAFSITANANTDKSGRNCVLYINAGSASTMVSINQSGKVPETRVTITNNSTYTLYRFRVVFINSRFEELTDRDFGTLDPGTTITADIPTSATEFYMATYSNYKWFFSPNYDVSYTNLSLSTSEINNWSTNSSANRYPKASSAN